MVDYDINMHLQSREISNVVSRLFQSTELKLYNNLTITGTFISLEYMSGLNPDIEHIVGLDFNFGKKVHAVLAFTPNDYVDIQQACGRTNRQFSVEGDS